MIACDCGNQEFSVSYQVSGRWTGTLRFPGPEGGRVESEADGDAVRTVRYPKTMRCTMCRKRRSYQSGLTEVP